jgi:hypothetical protein
MDDLAAGGWTLYGKANRQAVVDSEAAAAHKPEEREALRPMLP